jgi:hypothetical protein
MEAPAKVERPTSGSGNSRLHSNLNWLSGCESDSLRPKWRSDVKRQLSGTDLGNAMISRLLPESTVMSGAADLSS